MAVVSKRSVPQRIQGCLSFVPHPVAVKNTTAVCVMVSLIQCHLNVCQNEPLPGQNCLNIPKVWIRNNSVKKFLLQSRYFLLRENKKRKKFQVDDASSV